MAEAGAAASGFARERRTIASAWVALLLLMLASVGSAYLRLGAWNMVAGLVIAGIKAAIVAWLFMRLREAGALIRLAAAAGLGAWCLLLALAGTDYATRTLTAAPVQRPQLLLPAQAASEPR
jgi:cytochrome c oxidase subunit 4